MKKNNMIVIMDGFGLGKKDDNDAIHLANTPIIDSLLEHYPSTTLDAHGEAVGLPYGQMGNSEVGHLNIGAGRVINQSLLNITEAIEDGSLRENKLLKKAIEDTKERENTLHLIGLVSPGGVHSHHDHLYALLKMVKEHGLEDVIIHVILDGRDTPPTSGVGYIDLLEARMAHVRLGVIGTVSGRYYSMDRDENWDRTKVAYEAIVCGQGEEITNIKKHIRDCYEEGTTDEFIKPGVVGDYEGIKDEDTVIFFNFRPDRARQLTRAITQEDFSGFQRCEDVNTEFLTMGLYDDTLEGVETIYKDIIPEMTMGEFVSKEGLKQLRIAETEKYAHVTFFFNGGREKEFEGEDRILVPSPKVDTFDQKPEMAALEVTDEVIKAIESKEYDLIVLNFANPDMVGHTGNKEATIKAVETVDTQIGRIIDALEKNGGQAIITSDHGNADCMVDENADIMTSHTTNMVPMIVYSEDIDFTLMSGGKLSNIVPTMLDMMGMKKPKEMTENSLIERG